MEKTSKNEQNKKINVNGHMVQKMFDAQQQKSAQEKADNKKGK